MFGWLRRHIRKNYRPIPVEAARKYKEQLATAYAFLAWNLFALLIYYQMKKVFPKESSAPAYAELLGVSSAKVYKFDGLKQVDEYEISIDHEKRQLNLMEELYGEVEKE